MLTNFNFLPEGYHYLNGSLAIGDVTLDTIADEVGTPCYIYAADQIEKRYQEFLEAFRETSPLFLYAIKANSNLAVIKTLSRLGAGADTVSGGEIERALAAGVDASKIVYAGVAKTDAEIALALDAGILQFNSESEEEVHRIGAIALEKQQKASLALRVNPDVDAGTHAKISTGRKGDKFGIAIEDTGALMTKIKAHPFLDPVGLHTHIGSMIFNTDALQEAYGKLGRLYLDLVQSGIGLTTLDLGGGFGVSEDKNTKADLASIGKMAKELKDKTGCALQFEPGRSLVAEAGVLISQVVSTKTTGSRQFLMMDAGMHNLVRPAMYDAYHPALPLKAPDKSDRLERYDIAGPICESSDIIGRDRPLPPIKAGDKIALTMAGAYGFVMASNYNSRRTAAEILVRGDRWHVIKSPKDPKTQFSDEVIPHWL